MKIDSRVRSVMTAVIAIAFLIAQPAAAVASPTEGLSNATAGTIFTFVGPPIEGLSELEWLVKLNLTYLETLPATAVLNLPDRRAANLTKLRGETRGPDAFLWTGHGDGCTVLLSVAHTNVLGVISCTTGNYGISGDPSNPSGQLSLTNYSATVAQIPVTSIPGLVSLALFVFLFAMAAQARAGSRRARTSVSHTGSQETKSIGAGRR